jgi:hypothetical protein
MLKPAQHDKKNYVIPNLFRNLEFANDNELIAFVLVSAVLKFSDENGAVESPKSR